MSKRPHILVIDDDPAFRNGLAAALRSEFFISLAEDGKDAYNKAVQNRPQVAVLDIAMPQYDGMAMLRFFRRDIRLANIPIVVVTSDARRETVMACAQAGVKAYILKPSLKFPELAATIRTLLVKEGISCSTHNSSPQFELSARAERVSSHLCERM